MVVGGRIYFILENYIYEWRQQDSIGFMELLAKTNNDEFTYVLLPTFEEDAQSFTKVSSEIQNRNATEKASYSDLPIGEQLPVIKK